MEDIEGKNLTPEELEAVKIWQSQDASRLLYTPEESLIEMQKEKEPKPPAEEIKSKDVIRRIYNCIQRGDMSADDFEKFLRNSKEVEKVLNYGKGKYKHNRFVSEKLSEWQKFYKVYFGLDFDIEDIRVPEYTRGFDRLIVVGEGLSLPQIIARAKSFANFDIFDFFVRNTNIISDRVPQETYAVWARASSVPDSDLTGLSIDEIRNSSIDSMTIEEWILLEMFLVFKYGKPEAVNIFPQLNTLMDMGETWTLCSGTVLGGGISPAARYNLINDSVNISYITVTSVPSPNIGARRVIV